MKTLKVLLFVFVGLSSTWTQKYNNVCSNVEAYFDNMDETPNCWYDSDVDANPEQLAANHGFLLEKHDVKTDDDYILTTFRLKNLNGFYGNKVVFLQHGLGSDAECYMVNGNKSLAFFLSNQGFDVWIGNFRGGEFTRHKFLSRKNPKFWDFSFHEHGLYDLSANFKYIGERTKKKIIYIGHSMGGTSMGVYTSMKPLEAEKYINHAILLAPTFYMKNTKGLLSFNYVNNVYPLLTYASVMNLNVILETDSYERQLMQELCFLSLENARMCIDFVNLSSGKLPTTIAMERLPRALKVGKNAATKNILHYAQIIRTGEFQMFDYGPKKNMLIYNATTPSNYNLSKIRIPISFIYFDDDVIATKQDITYTYTRFRKPNWNIYGWPYNHLSFLIDNSVDKTFYVLLLKLINKNIP